MKPIIFSTPMVQAILEERKTQTRRIASMPNHIHEGTNIMDWDLSAHPYQKDGKWYYHVQTDVDDYAKRELKCRWQIGDILYVRETFIDAEDYPCAEYHVDPMAESRFAFKADCPTDQLKTVTWKPSIFMPKEAARLFLKITDIRVERLQDISEEDAIAEGVEERTHRCGGFGYYEAGGNIQDCVCQQWEHSPPIEGFKFLWQSINGEDSWKENPWVWCITFERTEKPL